MIKIADLVDQIITRSPFLTEAISEGLINTSALARKIQPEIEARLGKEIKQGAILMAIKRMSFGHLTKAEHALSHFVKQLSDISVRSNLSVYTFYNSNSLMEQQVRLLDIARKFPKSFCTFSQGVSETTIIVSDRFENEMNSFFKNEKRLSKLENISAISLLLPDENRQIYGLYYFILKELAYQGINMVELISTTHEFTIMVEQEDLTLTFAVLNNLINP
ncbi:MAG: aspartate kinase [Bacteroidota bacterium]